MVAYEKQNFEDGQILKAEHLRKMEEGIKSCGTPVFDLAEMGLEAVPVDGSPVSLDGDFSALCSAIENGTVKLKTKANTGAEIPIESVVTGNKINSQYVCTFTAELVGTLFVVSSVVTSANVTVKITPLDNYIDAYIGDVLGGEY